MKFPLAQFNKFCAVMPIDSKEFGQITLAKQIGTQTRAITEIVSGLEDGIHRFNILKARQLGITTITLALDLFWHFRFAGMQGTLASNDEENRDMFRSTLQMYYEGLPVTHRVRMVQNNRNFMSFANRSRIFMQIGGSAKSKGGKGRGKGITFIHATECSSWEDEESLASIIASLAEFNPQRLAVFESTARGFNLWHEIWEEGENAVSQKNIFIGWWHNEFYAKAKDTAEFRVYWDGKLTPDEREWVREIKLAYDFEITPEQIAWYRWKLAEDIHNEKSMAQDYPHTARHAFVLTGDNFFSPSKIEERIKQIERQPTPKFYRFRFTDDFMETSAEETTEKLADLTVWEENDMSAVYSIGADPAFGSSDWADRFVVQVWRCYADRFEQVAEFCTADLNTYTFAWVLCYLAGYYRNSMINLEINGPGSAVQAEINNLRRRQGMLSGRPEGRALTDVLGHLKYYLYQRLDSPTGGGRAYHTVMSRSVKDRMLNMYLDLFNRNQMVVNSDGLLDEMKIFVRDEDGSLQASGRGKDDRVMATALAVDQYVIHQRSSLERRGMTWEKERTARKRLEAQGAPETPMQIAGRQAVSNYLNAVGVHFGPK